MASTRSAHRDGAAGGPSGPAAGPDAGGGAAGTSAEELEFALALEREEHAGTRAELARVSGHLDRVLAALRAAGLEHHAWGVQDPAPGGPPDEVRTVSEAVRAAERHLRAWLTISRSAARDLHGVDTAPEAAAWAATAHRGLRALAAYARARREEDFAGGFWAWCAQGGSAAVCWPASEKKLAMRESETVMGCAKYRRTRVFDVDPRVEPSGRMVMQAHLKISEGGGDLAPRIYFHDDTGGATGRVHVGFVGPHHLVPNTRA